MCPAQLGLRGGQVVVSQEAIAHHNPSEGSPEQFRPADEERLCPYRNTVISDVTMNYRQPRFPLELLP